MLQRFGPSNRHAIIAAAVSVVFFMCAAPVQAQELRRGELRFQQGGKSYAFPLLDGKFERGSLRLAYLAPGDDELAARARRGSIQFELENVRGPGKYGMEVVSRVYIKTEAGHARFSRPGIPRCTFELTRVAPAGIEGIVACTNLRDVETNREIPPLSGKFTALP